MREGVLRQLSAPGPGQVIVALVVTVVAWPAAAPAASVPPEGLAVTSPPLQSGRNLERPPTWRARYDDVAGERVYLVMRPGWHVNPGPAGIFWDPGSFAAGNYSVSSTIFLFPAGSGEPPATVDAPYGVLFAGEGLDGATPSYATFLLRNDGSFRVALHRGDEVEEIVAWTSHDAVATWAPGSEDTARNVLGIDLTAEEVSFWVNDTRVATVPRADLPSEGIVGVRAGEGVSLHITDIVIGANRRR